jgi:hypothetical protein
MKSLGDWTRRDRREAGTAPVLPIAHRELSGPGGAIGNRVPRLRQIRWTAHASNSVIIETAGVGNGLDSGVRLTAGPSELPGEYARSGLGKRGNGSLHRAQNRAHLTGSPKNGAARAPTNHRLSSESPVFFTGNRPLALDCRAKRARECGRGQERAEVEDLLIEGDPPEERRGAATISARPVSRSTRKSSWSSSIRSKKL